jgi:ankyrin repeat protein
MFMLQVQLGHEKCLDCCLHHNAQYINARDANGETALFKACFENKVDCVKVLIKYGADPNIPREFMGCTPLNIAARKGHSSCVDALLVAGASLWSPLDCYGVQEGDALHSAAAGGQVSELEKFLKLGMDVDGVIERNGETALMSAAYFGHSNIAHFLLDYGCDTTLRNRCGETALDIAREQKHLDCVQVLETHAKNQRKLPIRSSRKARQQAHAPTGVEESHGGDDSTEHDQEYLGFHMITKHDATV